MPDDVQAKLAHAGELLIRAAAVIGTLTKEQQAELNARTEGKLTDCLAWAIQGAASICPAVAESLKTHAPQGFAAYTELAAKNTDQRVAVLEDLGYEIQGDSDQAGAWVWMAPTDSCEASFATKEQAIESAWADAVSQTKSIHEMSDLDWSSLSLDDQLSLIKETLLDERLAHTPNLPVAG